MRKEKDEDIESGMEGGLRKLQHFLDLSTNGVELFAVIAVRTFHCVFSGYLCRSTHSAHKLCTSYLSCV